MFKFQFQVLSLDPEVVSEYDICMFFYDITWQSKRYSNIS